MGSRLGDRLRLAGVAFRRQEDDEHGRHPADAVVRRRAAAEGPGRAEGQCPRDVRAGPRQQLHHAYSGIDEGPQGARIAGRRRPASDHLGLARSQGRPHRRHVSAAGRYAVRVQGLARRHRTSVAVGRADREADLRVEGRPRSHVPCRQEARLRRQDVQEHQGREQPARRRRISCARSTAAAGRPAIAASRPSGSRRT